MKTGSSLETPAIGRKPQSRSSRYKSQLAVLVALMLAGSMWFYVERVLIPYQRADAAAHERPRGNLSDLYPRWLGARELLLHHRDPYSAAVSREIQAGYYGRELDSSRPNDPKDQQGFAYPVYVVFLLAPTIGLPFHAVQAGFRWLLVILTGGTVWLWLRALRWQVPGTTVAVLLILTLGSFPAAQGIKLQQLSLLMSGLIAGCAALLVCGYLFMAGVFLALATIKPQLVAPLAAWLIFWALWDWQRRNRLVWGFGVTMAVLLGGSEWLLPGWLGRFHEAISVYRQYTGGGKSLLDVLMTPGFGDALAVLLLVGLAAMCWRLGREPADSESFALMLALVLAVTVVIIPMFAPYNQLLLLPGIFLAVRSWKALWRTSWLGRLVCVIAVLLVAWPWLASLGLMMAAPWLSAFTLQRGWAVPIYTSLGIPLGVLGVLALLILDRVGASKVQGTG